MLQKGGVQVQEAESDADLDGALVATQPALLVDTGLPGGDLYDWAGGDASGLAIASSSIPYEPVFRVILLNPMLLR